MALWDKVLSFFAGEAAGAAASDVVKPAFEPTRQNSWARRPYAILEPAVAALIKTKGIPSEVDLEDDARRNGIGPARFDLLEEAARRYPGTAELIEVWRRGLIEQADFTKAMRRNGVPDEWIGHLSHLKNARLNPAQIALGVVRSLLKDPGFLPVNLDTTGGKVPAYGVSPLDTMTEAEDSGLDRERLRILVGEIGLPMPPDAAAQSVFRDIIEREDFNRAVLEGDTRPEWAHAIFEHARQIPSVADYVNAHIRGWITRAEMREGAARHGMSADDVDLLYLRTGRPAAPGQMATAAARGINGPDGVPMNREQFLKGIAESDIRPEWGPMLWESRFLYPSLFQLNRLVDANAIDTDTAADWATKARDAPEVVAKMRVYWDSLGGTKADTHTAKAQTQLWTAAHRSYLTGELTDAAATDALADAGVPAGSIPNVLRLWAHEANLARKRLTAAQIKRAYLKAGVNAATGAAWTRDEALAALGGLGYPPLQANDYLNL